MRVCSVQMRSHTRVQISTLQLLKKWYASGTFAFGAYSFDCDGSDGFDLLFVWLNDHQICNTGAYKNSPSSTDGTAVYPMLGKAKKPDMLRIQALPKHWMCHLVIPWPACADQDLLLAERKLASGINARFPSSRQRDPKQIASNS